MQRESSASPFHVAITLIAPDDKGEETMSPWPDYNSALFVNRPQAIEKIHRYWADDPNAKRVLVLVAPPGSGKSWLLRKVKEEWEPKRLVIWLDAPILIRQEEQNPNQMLNQAAFDEWFKEVQQIAGQFCGSLRPIGLFAALDAQIEALVEMVCNCALHADPILVVDAYDEIGESRALILSLRVLAKFISRPCTRLLIAVRAESLIREDTLRRHQELFYLTKEDALDKDFALRQFEKWLAHEYPGHPLPANLNDWMATYRHYAWRNPAINHFLFCRALSTNPFELQSLGPEDLRECVQEIVQRSGKYDPLSTAEFNTVFQIATKLKPEWSYLEAETLLATSFYTNASIRRLLEMGVIRWQAGLFYRVESSLRELLLEIHARTSTPQEDAL